MTEGVYPKINGDALYSSEINRLAQGGYLAHGSFVTRGVNNLGSIFIGAGSLSNPVTLLINFSCNKGSSEKIGFSFSGNGANTGELTFGSATSAAENVAGYIMANLGSFSTGYNGTMYATTQEVGGDGHINSTVNKQILSASARITENVYPNSGLVISFSGIIPTTSIGSVYYYTLQALSNRIPY